eukprot:1737798-Prorocentrum_lima.AAC.1
MSRQPAAVGPWGSCGCTLRRMPRPWCGRSGAGTRWWRTWSSGAPGAAPWRRGSGQPGCCLLYTSDAADDM